MLAETDYKQRMSKRSPIKISKAQRHQQHIECQLGQEIPRVFTYRTYPDDYKVQCHDYTIHCVLGWYIVRNGLGYSKGSHLAVLCIMSPSRALGSERSSRTVTMLSKNLHILLRQWSSRI